MDSDEQAHKLVHAAFKSIAYTHHLLLPPVVYDFKKITLPKALIPVLLVFAIIFLP